MIPRESSPRTVLWVCMVGIAATTFPVTVFSASLPEVAEDLNTSETAIAWVLSAPFLAMAVFTPIAGKFGDLRGHRFAYLLGFVLHIVFSLLTAISWDVGSLIVFRTLGQGTGAVTGPAAVAILLKSFSPPEQSKALGYWSAVTAISPAIGVALGGALIDGLGWRVVFLIEAVIATAAVITAYYVIPETQRRPSSKIDIVGPLLLSTGVGALMVGVNRGAEWGFLHPASALTLAASPFLLTLFFLYERDRKDPFFPVAWLAKRDFSATIAATFFLNAAYLGAFSVAPFLLDRVFGYGISTRAAILIIRPLLFAAGAAIGGSRAERYGARRIVLLGTSFLAVSSVIMGLAAPFEALVLILLGLAASGFGHGYARPSLLICISNSVEQESLGLASGTFNTVSLVGASLGTNIMITIIGSSDETSLFVFAYLVATVLALLAVAAASTITGKPKPFMGPEDNIGPFNSS